MVQPHDAREKAIEKSKLMSFEFYCWRHTFGTRMAESGVDRFALARLMGIARLALLSATTSM
jgi:hypothetical protein